MVFLEDVYFGKREEATHLFNHELTLGDVLTIAREEAFKKLRDDYKIEHSLDTLFACVRLPEEEIKMHIGTHHTKEHGVWVVRDVSAPVKVLRPNPNADPRYIFALGDKERLESGVYLIRADTNRETKDITLDKIEIATNGVSGSVDEWIGKMLFHYLEESKKRIQDAVFEKFHLYFFKGDYTLSVYVGNDPFVKKMHVDTNGKIRSSY